MSKQPAVRFTADQMRAMIDSGKVLNTIDDATRDYTVKKHTPDDNPHPYLTFFEDFLAEAKIAMRTLILPLNDGKVLSIRLQRDFSSKDPNSFDSTWGIELPGAEYNSYRTLNVVYIGHVRVGIRNTSAIMKDIRKQQQGFTIVEIIIVIVIVAILAVGGWLVYDRNFNKSSNSSQTTTSTEVVSDATINSEVPEVKNASDLKKLDTQLNDASLGDTNVSDLNSQLDF